VQDIIKVAVDAMGGDIGIDSTVEAAVKVANRLKNIQIVLVGDKQKVEHKLNSLKLKNQKQIKVQHSSQVVAMDELPSSALRGKKDSSMRVAINLVKSGKVSACVSAGNTGALMATAKFVLKTLPGIDRPAITTAMPTKNGFVRVLDLGANIDCTSMQLYQFAIMGYVLAKTMDNNSDPSVGLLNVGVEEIKGSEQIKEAHALLSKIKNLNYYGFVEGDDIFSGTTDIVVADGFVGNVLLKTTEGLVKMIVLFLKQAYSANIFAKIVALLSLPVLKNFKRKLDPRRYNGASLLGLNGIVIKSHGSADVLSFASAIEVAYEEVANDVTKKLQDAFSVYKMEK
jgi:phosphate acyltransferase